MELVSEPYKIYFLLYEAKQSPPALFYEILVCPE